MDENQRVRLWDEYWRPLYDSAKDGPDYSRIIAAHEMCNARFESPNGPIYVGTFLRSGQYLPWGEDAQYLQKMATAPVCDDT